MVQTRRARGAVTDAGERPSLARDAHTFSPLVAAFLDTRSVADLIGALGKKLARTDAIWHAHAPVLVAYADRLFLAANAECVRIGFTIGKWDDASRTTVRKVEWTSTWQEMACQSLCKRASVARVQMEYLAWKLYPIPGFEVELDGSIGQWKVVVPGPQGTFLHNAEYDTKWTFNAFPFEPPRVKFDPPIFHPNVFPSGTVCSALLNDEECFDPRFRCRDLMLNLQHFLLHANLNCPEQMAAYQFLVSNQDHLAYAVKLRDSGRAVFRSNEPFGHLAVPHVVFDEEEDFMLHELHPGPGPKNWPERFAQGRRALDLDPARPLSHAIYPAVLHGQWPPVGYVG
jgi:ubiquitin-conjugating enzyme E2 I